MEYSSYHDNRVGGILVSMFVPTLGLSARWDTEDLGVGQVCHVTSLVSYKHINIIFGGC